MKKILMIILLVIVSNVVYAVEKLRVVALFSDRAMLAIDGRNRLLKVGERSPEGVELMSADSFGAVVKYAGITRSLRLGQGVASSYKRPDRIQQRVVLGADGAYSLDGSINGNRVSMVVDTGANTIALSALKAQMIGLNYKQGRPVIVQTASGIAKAYKLDLPEVRAGNIELRNVEAVVIEGNMPAKVLLGMSFLSRLDIRHQGNLMILTKSH
jgi:aspartyl protease family protein